MEEQQPLERYKAAIADTLRAEKAARKIEHSQIEELTGIKERTLWRIFAGQRDLTTPEAFLIADALGLTYHEFIDRVEARLGN